MYLNLQTILECRVCDEVFCCQGDKVPRLLICGHTVCHHCLSRLPVHGRVILCPFDRQPTDIGKEILSFEDVTFVLKRYSIQA